MTSLIVALAMIQVAVTWVLFLLTYAGVMNRFDTGEALTPVDGLIRAAAELFAFPILTLVRSLELRLPGLLGWVPFILNGFLWSAVVVWLLGYRGRRSVVRSS